MIKVRLKGNSYNIVIGNRILPKLGILLKTLSIGQDAVIITNHHVRGLHEKSMIDGLNQNGFSIKFFEVPDSEKSKSAKVAFGLIEKIASYDTKKKIFIIALGGGVVGDFAGYVAAIYKRGIPYIQVPTTLLAQIDSAIGGKVAIDLEVGKNLVGAFYQPKLVFSDTSLLRTLDKRQIRNGLAEAVKYGVIRDKKLFDYIEKNYKQILSLKGKAMTKIVLRCSQIKADVVASDERETKGKRTILNFGHTVGHAIEAASQYSRYGHGEAVALGMRVASRIACRMGLFNKNESLRIERLLSNIGLPTQIKGVKLASILKAVAHDKKFHSKENRFVLPIQIGKVEVVKNIPQEIIRGSIESCL